MNTKIKLTISHKIALALFILSGVSYLLILIGMANSDDYREIINEIGLFSSNEAKETLLLLNTGPVLLYFLLLIKGRAKHSDIIFSCFVLQALGGIIGTFAFDSIAAISDIALSLSFYLIDVIIIFFMLKSGTGSFFERLRDGVWN